ncbi:hypothetical protein MTP99_005223 [Tenebrio molitor]|nr:hypothetical protein MTP99_005223 [Tenebrio molitor]CAH1381238.1 unnamed protein product [Tenebrio molitor]
MEICRCEEYRRVVENFKFFICGTMHHLEPREPVRKNHTVLWVKNRMTHDNPRFTKPVIVQTKICKCEGLRPRPEIETKWIPVLPGLISQKIVNEDAKDMKMLLG